MNAPQLQRTTVSQVNGQAWSSVGFLLLSLGLLLYPSLSLVVRGVANIGLFMLVLGAMLYGAHYYWQQRKQLSQTDAVLSSRNGTTDSEPPHFLAKLILCCAAPLAVMFISQAWHGRFVSSTFDAPSRFLLIVPVYVWLRQFGLRLTPWVAASFPLAAIVLFCTSFTPWFLVENARLRAPFLDAIHLGDCALLFGGLSLCLIGLKRHALVLLLAAALAGAYVSYLTQSRGGWLAVPVVVVFLFLSHAGLSRQKKAIGIAVALALCAALTVLPFVQGRIQNAWQDTVAYQKGDKDTSLGIRWQHWQMAVQLAHDEPLLGAGAWGAKRNADRMVQEKMLTPVAGQIAKGELHNEFLAFLADYGVLGFLAMLALHIVPIVLFFRQRNAANLWTRRLAWMGMAYPLSFLVFGLTVETFNLSMMTALYATQLASLFAVVYARDA